MLDNFKFETFVDAHSNIFEEYLSSVISKLRETNSEYRSIEEKIESLYRQYPKVMAVFDTEKGECFPSVRRIAEDLKVSKATVFRAFNELETNGLLERFPRHHVQGGRRSSLYKIKGEIEVKKNV